MKENVIDAICISQIKKGNERALMRFYCYFRKPLFSFVNRQLRDVQVSEEIVQDIFLASIDSIREEKEIASISAYMYAIARHKIIDYLRKKKIKKILLSAIPEYIVNGYASSLFREDMQKKELTDSIHHVFKKMPNEYALIIRLKYIEGLSVGEIARKLSIKFKAAESMLFRARKVFSSLYHST